MKISLIKTKRLTQPATLVFIYLLGLSFTLFFVDHGGQSTLIDELVLLAMLPLASIGIFKQFNSIGLPAKFLVAYFIIAAMSSIIALVVRNDIPLAAPIVGLVLDTKFLIFLGALLFFAKKSKKGNDEIILDICKVVVFLGLINAAFFIRDIFSGGISLSGISLRQSPVYGHVPIGLFSHKVSTATISALSLISCYVLYLTLKKKAMLFYIAVFTIVLIFSYSFKELLILTVIYLISLRALSTGTAKTSRANANFLLATLLAIPAIFILFGDQIVSLINNRVSTYGYGETVRGLLYEKSAMIAFDYFPFGSGAGTFSSQPSTNMYYSPLYYEYNISHYYGTTPNNPSFLMDVGWAKFFAEAGLIGGSAYALAYIYVFTKLFKSMIIKPNTVNMFGVLVGGLIFSSALGQAIFTAELGILLCGLYFFTYYLNYSRIAPRAN